MKKTIKKRAFVSAIAMLIVSAIVLTSSTFAWFSMSKQATVEEMQLNVASPEGIQISANASTWTSTLTQDEFFNPDSTSRHKAYDGNVNLLPSDLTPVSNGMYGFNSTTGYANFLKATLDDSKRASVRLVNQESGKADEFGAVAFDLFFKVAADTDVYFGTSEFEDLSGAKNTTALRLGFQFLGNTTSTVADDAINLKSSNRADCIIYEPDAQRRSDDAEGLGEGAKTTMYLYSTNAGGNYADANYVLNDFVLDVSTYCHLFNNTMSNDAKVFHLNAGVSKVRVYIWMEGQDVDCQNSVAGSQLTAALKFTIR